ncbi:MAG: hypothetical protein AAGL23_06110 [Pseudomonadota bacterium]
MHVFKRLSAVILPLFILVACEARAPITKDEMLQVARTDQPNTALIFWDNKALGGLERIVLGQDDVIKGTISPGQVTAVPLQTGDNSFLMYWEEFFGGIPATKTITLQGLADGPTYLIIREVNAVVFGQRGFESVSRAQFLAAVQNARVPQTEGS